MNTKMLTCFLRQNPSTDFDFSNFLLFCHVLESVGTRKIKIVNYILKKKKLGNSKLHLPFYVKSYSTPLNIFQWSLKYNFFVYLCLMFKYQILQWPNRITDSVSNAKHQGPKISL